MKIINNKYQHENTTSHLVPLAECLVWVAHPHPVVEALALAVLQPLQVRGGAGLQLEHCKEAISRDTGLVLQKVSSEGL